MEKLYNIKNKLKLVIYNFLYTIMDTSGYAMWQQDEYGNWIYANEDGNAITG